MALFTFVSFVLFVLFVLDSGFKYASQMPGKTLRLMHMGRNPALLPGGGRCRARAVKMYNTFAWYSTARVEIFPSVRLA